MLLFGHIGCGHGLVTPWRRTLPFWLVTLGTLLPDLIDKVLYYGARGHLVATTRTFGHTGLAIAILWLLARRYRALLGIAAGATTHVLLDLALDLTALSRGPSTTWIALTWPLHGLAFPADPYTGLTSHVAMLLGDPRIVISEIVGLVLTAWALRRRGSYNSVGSERPLLSTRPRRAARGLPTP